MITAKLTFVLSLPFIFLGAAPALATEVQLSTSGSHTCALYENQGKNKVLCWGNTNHGGTNVPSLENPTCLGFDSAGTSVAPPLSFPQQ